MKEHSHSSVTEEQRRAGQKDQDLVCNGFSGHDTSLAENDTHLNDKLKKTNSINNYV
jgi:hypothetical protein